MNLIKKNSFFIFILIKNRNIFIFCSSLIYEYKRSLIKSNEKNSNKKI